MLAMTCNDNLQHIERQKRRTANLRREKGRAFSACILAGLPVLLLLLSCARIQSPPGGPVDESPPKLVKTVPQTGDTWVPLETPIEIVFDEYIVEAQNAVVFLPEAKDVKIKFKGKKIVVAHDGLAPNTTYRLSISTKLKDQRNNPLKRAISFAFSTGGVLDSLFLRGRVYDESLKPIHQARVHAYNLYGGSLPDTLPAQPYGITWTSENGDFEMTNLPAGDFLVVAFDEDNEQIAIAPEILRSGEQAPWALLLFEADTIAPEVLHISADNRNILRVKFTEPVVLAHRATVSVVPPLGRYKLFHYEQEPENVGLFAYDGLPVGELRFTIVGVSDERGNAYEPHELSVEVPDFPEDTAAPSLKVSKERLLPSQPLTVNFDKPILEGEISVSDSTGKAVPGSTVAIIPDGLVFYPKSVWPLREDLSWRLESVTAVDHTSLSDTTHRPLALEKAAGLGTINLLPPLPCENIIAFAKHAGYGGESLPLIKTSDGYTADPVEQGDYLLWFFCDDNGDSVWLPGSIRPLSLSEKAFVHSDTVNVRGLWITDVIIGGQ